MNMHFELDSLSVQKDVKPGEELVLFDARSGCSSNAWRLLSVEADQPIQLRLEWVGLLPLGRARLTGRSVQVCLQASALKAWATNLGATSASVQAGAQTAAERVTANVFDVAMPTQGAVTPPPCAYAARLDVPPLDNPTAARIELLNAAGDVIAIGSPGQTVPLGAAAQVRSVCPLPHRVLFCLLI